MRGSLFGASILVLCLCLAPGVRAEADPSADHTLEDVEAVYATGATPETLALFAGDVRCARASIEVLARRSSPVPASATKPFYLELSRVYSRIQNLERACALLWPGGEGRPAAATRLVENELPRTLAAIQALTFAHIAGRSHQDAIFGSLAPLSERLSELAGQLRER